LISPINEYFGVELFQPQRIGEFKIVATPMDPMALQYDESSLSSINSSSSNDSFILHAPDKDKLSFYIDLLSKVDGELLGMVYIFYSYSLYHF
jgi:hypothetical protein